MISLFDYETSFQEFETKVKETVDPDDYAEAGKENPAKVVTKIYTKMCRPQMYFGIDTKAEYKGVIEMMKQFIRDYPEFPEMNKYMTQFESYVNEKYGA